MADIFVAYASEDYADALDSGIWFAFFRAHLNYVWRQTFPECYEDPRFDQLLRKFKIDAASTAEIRVPALPF